MLEIQKVTTRERASISVIDSATTENLISAQIDAHDNRVTITHIKASTEPSIEKAIDLLCAEMKSMGGKQIIILDKKLFSDNKDFYKVQESFIKNGFLIDMMSSEATKRLRTTTVKDITEVKNVLAIEPKNSIHLSFDKDEIKSYTEQIFALMLNSGFSAEKIADYKSKGEVGIPLMYQEENSTPCALINNKNELVGIFRLTRLGNDIFYISDTFINENTDEFPILEGMPAKAGGTAYLYYSALSSLLQQDKITGSSIVLLIAPPNRVTEFEKFYGCKVPNTDTNSQTTILGLFSPPGERLTAVFKEQIRLPPVPSKHSLGFDM